MVKVNGYIVVTSIVVIILVGCTKAPSINIYSIEVPKVVTISKKRYKDKVIKIAFPYSQLEDISQKMNFSYSKNNLGTYLNSQWSNNVAKLLQGTMIELLQNSHIFKAVLSENSTLKGDYRLETNIFTFEHQVRGEKSYAVISLQFTLINSDTGELVKSKIFNYKEATSTTNAKGYAYATNKIVKQLSSDLLDWL